ncbi:MAG TPA: hypothetical protein VFF96_04255 [Pseudoxanthomonas sp.]|nr:hypothetical protein [Pseudoxanthomonas sp.]
MAASALMGLMVLGLGGVFVRFIPAAGMQGLRMVVVFGLFGAASTIALFALSAREGRLRLGGGFLQIVGRSLAIILFMPALLGFLAWASVCKALPWAYTRAFGMPYEELTIMRTEYSHSRRGCDYRLEGGAMENSIPAYLCIRESYYRRHPDQDVEVVIYGRKSALGFSVQGVRSAE